MVRLAEERLIRTAADPAPGHQLAGHAHTAAGVMVIKAGIARPGRRQSAAVSVSDCPVTMRARPALGSPGCDRAQDLAGAARLSGQCPCRKPLGPTGMLISWANFFRIMLPSCGSPLRNRTVDLLLNHACQFRLMASCWVGLPQVGAIVVSGFVALYLLLPGVVVTWFVAGRSGPRPELAVAEFRLGLSQGAPARPGATARGTTKRQTAHG